MTLKLERLIDTGHETVGILYNRNHIEGTDEFLCFTLEDEKRTQKIYAETRIPAGTYKINLRTEGRMHLKYSGMFPKVHVGMLHLTDVPNFEFILIHTGNDEDDTAGCILVGSYPVEFEEGRFRIEKSTKAYEKIYHQIAKEISTGGNVFITIIDN